MNYEILEHYVSKPRLNRYLEACSNSRTKAQKLYEGNVRISQSFYPVLNLFETFIRNTLNYRLSEYFADPDWIINEKNGFMSDGSLLKSKFYLKRKVLRSELIIKRQGSIVTSGKVIAEQSFGFWTSLFEPHHYKLISGVVIQPFSLKPEHINRNIILRKLNGIRKLRNRIYHNEPICFDGTTINISRAANVKKDIYTLLSWIDDLLPAYVATFDSSDAEMDFIKKL